MHCVTALASTTLAVPARSLAGRELLADVCINLTRGQDALLIVDDAQEGAEWRSWQ